MLVLVNFLITLDQLVKVGYYSGFKYVAMHGIDGLRRGYIELPHDHPWLNEAPRNITFVEGNWIGFDTESKAIVRSCKELCEDASKIYGDRNQ